MDILDISGILRDSRIDDFADFLQVSTEAARESIKNRTSTWQTNMAVLEARSERARILNQALRSNRTLRPLFVRLGELEPTVRSFLSSPSQLESESYGQIFFIKDGLRHLNFIPLFIAIWTFVKSNIYPFISVLLPILSVIGPYIVLKYIMKMPIEFGTYIEVALKTYIGNLTTSTDMISRLKTYGQLAMLCFTTIHSFYQPIQTSRHIKAINKTIMADADRISEFIDICEMIRDEFESCGIKMPRLPIPEHIGTDKYHIIAYMLESKFNIQLLLEYIGHWDVALAIAQNDMCSHVRWTNRDEIRIVNTCDIKVDAKKRIPFTISIGGDVSTDNHLLLTGPNRGGKSTTLRALITTAVLAHTYGIGIGSYVSMCKIDWIQSSLKMEDLPGAESFFEREVNFAKRSLRKPRQLRGLVCVDELFHSTNPPDAERTSREYLRQLWTRGNIFSMISTHIYSIVRDAPVRRVCCPAKENADGSVSYYYGLIDGICEVSSVNDIIRGAFDN
jgi:hypothetical protein